ncbi:hypothetical protein Goshw_001507, partial [Gossypium schwendimanii]|nr:hypothetical protein [Gossypium schwendimanii]
MDLMVGKDMATKSFAKTFVDIDLDDANDIYVNFEVEKNEEVILTPNPSSTRKESQSGPFWFFGHRGQRRCRRRSTTGAVADDRAPGRKGREGRELLK